jgi:hypothetical protein
MTRTILVALAAAVSVTVIAGTGCNATGVGDPCTPEAEYSQSFLGFDRQEVNVESKSFQCQTRLCLANHFQGRATCPYGQDLNGNGPDGTSKTGCVTPNGDAVNGNDPTTGQPIDPKLKATVKPQCAERTTAKAVYCSCRCADVDGNTPTDQVFCQCPTGFKCTQLVTSIGASDSGLTGAYCVRDATGSVFDPSQACTPCDPTTPKGNPNYCGPGQGVN